LIFNTAEKEIVKQEAHTANVGCFRERTEIKSSTPASTPRGLVLALKIGDKGIEG
jgi:hypothetical protein